MAAEVLAALPTPGNGQGSVTVSGRSLIYAARQTANGRIVLIRGARLAFAEWRPFLWSLVLAGLGGAVLATLLAWLLARRLTRPIGALSRATERVAAGEPDVEVPVQGSDELAGLGRSFNAMSAELGRARESQRRFLESVSHELKTPLTSIRGYAEALSDGAVTPAEGSRVVAAEADRLERLVSDLLDLARLGREGFAVEHQPVDLASVIDIAVQRHLPRARELGVSLSAAGNGDRAWAVGDEGRLLQATSNLIENALRLTPPGGAVTVNARPGEIAVTDTGPGTGRRGCAPRLRSLLSLQPLSIRTGRRLRPGPGDRQGADGRDGRRRACFEPPRGRRRIHPDAHPAGRARRRGPREPRRFRSRGDRALG